MFTRPTAAVRSYIILCKTKMSKYLQILTECDPLDGLQGIYTVQK